MIRNRLKLLGAGIGVLGMVLSLSSVAGADDIVPDSSTAAVTFSHPVTMNVTLVAVDDAGWNGDNQVHTLCNIRTSSGAQFVKTSVTSSAPNIATVSTGELDFTGCGQSFPITITGIACGSATININVFDTKTAAPTHVTYSDTSVLVTVTDPSCTGGTTGGGIGQCAQPAAPAWAAAILQKNGVKANNKTTANYISQVAKTMLQGASFPDYRPGHNPATEQVNKVDQGAYAESVWAYLKTITNGAVNTYGPQASARPGWECNFTPSA
jgi:hypothetical protein